MSRAISKTVSTLINTSRYKHVTWPNITQLKLGHIRDCNHSLIFAWFYWLLKVTWCKPLDSYHAITFNCVDICPPIVSVEFKHGQHKNFNFSFLLFKEGKQTRFIESNDSDIIYNTGGNCCSGKYKQVNKRCCQCLWRWRRSRVDF